MSHTVQMGHSLLRGFRVLLIFSYFYTYMVFGANAAPALDSQSTILASRPYPASVRILPLGNSITWGYGSSDGNGYRKVLFDALKASGTAVEYIGSVQSGTMVDNHNEGHPGAIITQIAAFATASLPQRPDIILLMAGTNDMGISLNLPDAPRRLGALIDQCYVACPDAVIMVAQLTPATNPVIQANINAFNPTVPGLVGVRVANGMKAVVVNMSAFVTTAYLGDGLHPNDLGYGQMAKGWLQGFDEANTLGWITPPINVTASGTTISAKPTSLSTTITSQVSTSISTSISTSKTTSTPTPTPKVAMPSATSGGFYLKIPLPLMVGALLASIL